MDLDSLCESLRHVIEASSTIEVDSHWMLTSFNLDDRRGDIEECRILNEVGDSQGGRHDN